MTIVSLPQPLIVPAPLDPVYVVQSYIANSLTSRGAFSGPVTWDDSIATKQLVAVWAVTTSTSSLAGNEVGFTRTGSVIVAPQRLVSDNVVQATARTLETAWMASPRRFFRIPFDVPTPVTKGDIVTLVFQSVAPAFALQGGVVSAVSNSRTGDATPWGVPDDGNIMQFVIHEDAIEAPGGGAVVFKSKTLVTAAGR